MFHHCERARRKVCKILWAPVFAALCLSAVGEEEIIGVDLELIPAVKEIGPSSTFTVGLKIHHHPGFHTYWQNPGAVGYPTRISWELPEGFVAGKLRWPVPEMSKMAIYPVYGYQSDVMLLVDISSAAELTGERLEFHADVTWMACSNECRPGEKRFSFTLPIGEKTKADPDLQELFVLAEANIPQELEGWKATLESKADEKKITFSLSPPFGTPDLGTFRIYSCDGQISSDPDPTITQLKDGSYLVEVERSKLSPKGASSLPFVLVGEEGLGAEDKNFGTLNPVYSAAQ